MSDEFEDEDFEENDIDINEGDDRIPDPNLPEVKKLASERKRFLREKIELRTMAKELGLSYEDYIQMLGD